MYTKEDFINIYKDTTKENILNQFYYEHKKYIEVFNKLEEYIESEKTRLARECSNIYEDSLGNYRLVSEDIFNELDSILNKLKELDSE